MASLLANLKLSASLGAHQAAIELNWMRKAANSPKALELMVQRRSQGEPLQYILGTQPFGHLNILTRAPTLIPRPETEQWTTELATKVSKRSVPQCRFRALDLCTGSGCIPLLLCHLLHETISQPIQMAALAVDIAPSACQLAQDNLASCGVPPGFSVNIRQKNLFDDDFWQFIKRTFREVSERSVAGDEEEGLLLDIITANPPYIPRDQWQRLPPEVKDWEDPLALLGDPHPGDTPDTSRNKGITFYKRIRELLFCPGILSSQSIVAMEVGGGQAADVAKLFDTGFGRTEIWKDWWGKERAVFVYGHAWC